jgi:hypothetical protein
MVFTSEHKKDSSLDRNGVFNNGEWTIIGHIMYSRWANKKWTKIKKKKKKN